MIVCLSGWKKSGKDEAAKSLIEGFKFERVAFADTLKDMVAEQYGLPRQVMDDQGLKEAAIKHLPVDPKDPFSQMIANFMDGEFAKDETGAKFWTPRALCILEGSVKRSVNSAYWVTRALSKASPDLPLVITDLRFKSEVAQVREFAESVGRKLLVIRINRFETSESNDPSERNMDDYDKFTHVVNNKSTLEEFRQKIESIVFENL